MAVEIERKFLVSGESWRRGAVGTAVQQGFLVLERERTVRVRIGISAASRSSAELEAEQLQIVRQVCEAVTLPVSEPAGPSLWFDATALAALPVALAVFFMFLGAVLGIFLALAVGLAVSLYLLAETDHERRNAEANFQMAMDAVQEMLIEVGLSEESLADLPAVTRSAYTWKAMPPSML